MAVQQRRFHWDKRKRRYVQLQPDEKLQAGGKRVRSESGARSLGGDSGPSGLFQKWARATRRHIVAPGQVEDTSTVAHDLSGRSVPM